MFGGFGHGNHHHGNHGHHGHHNGHGHGNGFGFNRWHREGYQGYMQQPGYVRVDYSGGWNPNVHDQMLLNNIRQVYMRYDMNRSGQLEGQ